MHDFRPELTNLMRSGRVNCKPLRVCNFHHMGCQLSLYGVKLSPYGAPTAKAFSEGPAAGPQPVDLKLRKLIVNLGNEYVRLSARDRRKVKHIIWEFSSGKTSKASYPFPWSKDDIDRCHLRPQPISQRMANDFRRWASEYREAEPQIRLALRSRIAELVRRKRIEEL